MLVCAAIWVICPTVCPAECPHVVLLSGDDESTANVSERLRTLEIETVPRPDCPAIPATVEQNSDGYILRMRLNSRDTYVREVEDIETVAVLIDAAVRDSAAALPMRSAAATSRSKGASPETTVPKNRSSPTISSGNSGRNLSLRLLYDVIYTFDSSLWMGGRIAACGHLGPICLGLQARFSMENTHGGLAGDIPVHRLQLGCSVTAQLPLEWGRWSLTPGLALGLGYYSYEYRPDNAPYEHPNVDHIGFRGAISVSLAVRATPRLHIEVLNLSVSLSAPHRTDVLPDDETLLTEPPGEVSGGLGIRYDISLGDG